ncbi:hypothetical protein SUGI_0685990 [Cryptomeria japonica]|nr:hypothetical protein SUGI_0685990 [Cryptomeria japonica]
MSGRTISCNPFHRHMSEHYPLVGDGDKWASPYDLLERLFLVDVVQRLGIHRYFEKEIEATLDYTYKHRNDGNEVFKFFSDENGQFVLRPPSEEESHNIRENNQLLTENI